MSQTLKQQRGKQEFLCSPWPQAGGHGSEPHLNKPYTLASSLLFTKATSELRGINLGPLISVEFGDALVGILKRYIGLGTELLQDCNGLYQAQL